MAGTGSPKRAEREVGRTSLKKKKRFWDLEPLREGANGGPTIGRYNKSRRERGRRLFFDQKLGEENFSSRGIKTDWVDALRQATCRRRGKARSSRRKKIPRASTRKKEKLKVRRKGAHKRVHLICEPYQESRHDRGQKKEGGDWETKKKRPKIAFDHVRVTRKIIAKGGEGKRQQTRNRINPGDLRRIEGNSSINGSKEGRDREPEN